MTFVAQVRAYSNLKRSFRREGAAAVSEIDAGDQFIDRLSQSSLQDCGLVIQSARPHFTVRPVRSNRTPDPEAV